MSYKKTSDKYHEGKCKICGYLIYSEAHDENGEEGACSKCGYKACEHNVESWTTITEATCVEDGEEQATCSICNKTIKRKIPALGHTVTNFTKTDIFNHSGNCDNCGENAKIAHEFSEVSLTNGKEGKKYYKCDCGVLLEVPEDFAYDLADLLGKGFNIISDEWGKANITIDGKEYTVYKATCNNGVAEGVVFSYLVPVNS